MEEVYDALSQAQKHIMLKNGMFEFDTFKPGTCCCGHSVSDHLDRVDCCLCKELCDCERYLDENSRVTVPQKLDGKLPQKQKEDKQLDSYIQQIARM
jgi:hypothetical protein